MYTSTHTKTQTRNEKDKVCGGGGGGRKCNVDERAMTEKWALSSTARPTNLCLDPAPRTTIPDATESLGVSVFLFHPDITVMVEWAQKHKVTY